MSPSTVSKDLAELFVLGEPSQGRIAGFLREQREEAFSYEEVGATRKDVLPAGYVVDRYRVRLGEGEEAFGRAKAALRAWRQFDFGWVRILPRGARIEAGTTIAERGGVERFGFAYGTLPGHGEQGEERFTVERRREDDSVYYDVLAFSRPNHPLAWLGYPLARMLHRCCARDSQAAMVRATVRAETAP